MTTPGWEWDGVDDNTTQIDDAGAVWEDFYGVPGMFGWNNDAFDGFIYTLNMTYNEDGQPPVVLNDITLTNDSTSINDNGLSTIVALGVADFGNGNIVAVEVTLEIEGSYARWSFDFDDGGAGILGDVDAQIIGDLGSDGATEVHYNSGAELVTSEGAVGDPVIGYHIETAGPYSWQVADGNEDIGVTFNAASDSSFTLALSEFDPCQYEEAISQMVTRSSSLNETFGESIEPLYEPGCVVPATAAPISLGSAVNQALPISGSAEWVDALGDFTGQSAFTGFVISGLPAGLSASIVFNNGTGNSEVVVTGTATTPGEYLVTLLGYYSQEFEGEVFNGSPLFLELPLSVVLPATGPADAAPVGLIALALLGLGGAIVFVNTRLRRA